MKEVNKFNEKLQEMVLAEIQSRVPIQRSNSGFTTEGEAEFRMKKLTTSGYLRSPIYAISVRVEGHSPIQDPRIRDQTYRLEPNHEKRSSQTMLEKEVRKTVTKVVAPLKLIEEAKKRDTERRKEVQESHALLRALERS